MSETVVSIILAALNMLVLVGWLAWRHIGN
jgi:hypothetical protein